MLVKCYDSNGRSGEFEYKVNKNNMLQMATVSRKPGFMKTDTVKVEFLDGKDVIPVSTNAWSFFEHTLTFERLCKVMDGPGGVDFVKDFLIDFENTNTDDVALNLWLANEVSITRGSSSYGM